MESWFLRNCVYNRMGVELGLQEEAMMGDHYAFMWHGWSDTTLERGEILKADGNKNFAFTFTGMKPPRWRYIYFLRCMEGIQGCL